MSDVQAQKRQRTCIACGSKADKVQLHRIVRKADGTVAFDPTGRMAGRGAYVCSAKCLENAMKKRKLQNALRSEITTEQMQGIIDSAIETLGRIGMGEGKA